MRDEDLRAMLRDYQAVVFQDVYTPEYREAVKKRRNVETAKKKKKQLDDDSLLKRLEKLTEKE